MMRSTPKTMNEAIKNGIDEAKTADEMSRVIESHIRDFIAQRFAVAYLQGDTEQVKQFQKLWKSITEEKK